jgi:hypothetical protein
VRNFYAIALFINVLIFFSPEKTAACGYAWVGECSSAVHLRINGTLDSFTIADCSFGLRFDGMYLGTLQNLSLANARAITWESCQNNVSAVNLRYRVYPNGASGGNWQTLSLQEDYNTLVGPYTTRYRSKPSDLALTNGLTIGQTYVLEVFLLAEVDTIGDDFIPETTLAQNNNGQNYRLTFTYGGPAATPFVVVPTRVREPKCAGGNDGSISVSVWGDHTGLFYYWSNTNLNFYQQNNLSAGTYIVTVAGANYTESDTVVLGQPAPVSAQFTNIQSVACGGGIGSATALPSGGTGPYTFQWQNNQSSPTATFGSSGNWALTITDSKGCTGIASVSIPNGGAPIVQNLSREICAGETLQIGGQTFSQEGLYSLTLPASNGGCDTLIHLTINILSPSDAIESLPAEVLVTCSNPSVNLCAAPLLNTHFEWYKDGVPATPTACLLVTAGGTYTVQAFTTGFSKTCIASKSIVSQEHLLPPNASIVGSDTLTCNGFGPYPTLLRALTNVATPSFSWTYENELISTGDSCWFQLEDFGTGGVQLPALTVTDEFGCSSSATTQFSILLATDVPNIAVGATNASGPNAADGSAAVQILGGVAPYAIDWGVFGSTDSISSLPPGIYCVAVSDANGCSSVACAEVGFASGASSPSDEPLRLYPTPATLGGRVWVDLPSAFLGKEIRLELLDIQGRMLWAAAPTMGLESVGFRVPEGLSEGLFWLRITSAEARALGKLLLKE